MYHYVVVLLAMPWDPVSLVILGLSRACITCICRQIFSYSYPLASTAMPAARSVERESALRLLHCSPRVHGLIHGPNELDANYVAKARGENKRCRMMLSPTLDPKHIGCSKILTKSLKKTLQLFMVTLIFREIQSQLPESM